MLTNSPGKVVFVVGASRGIGLACAGEFLKAGCSVGLGVRESDPNSIAKILMGLSGYFKEHYPEFVLDETKVKFVTCDVRSSDSVDLAFSNIEDTFGICDVVIANAGITRDQLTIRMSNDQWRQVLDTNLTGTFNVARRAATKMLRARRGSIIFIASVSGMLGQAGQANYSASKAGLIGLARSMARELASRSITVNVISPGAIDTDMLGGLSADQLAKISERIPMERVGNPCDVARLAVFLGSDYASYITGTNIAVDGGLGMGG